MHPHSSDGQAFHSARATQSRARKLCRGHCISSSDLLRLWRPDCREQSYALICMPWQWCPWVSYYISLTNCYFEAKPKETLKRGGLIFDHRKVEKPTEL